MRKGVGGKKLTAAAAVAAGTKSQGSGPQQQAQQLPEPWQNAGLASGAGGGGPVGGAAAAAADNNAVEDDSDDAVLLPTPPHEMTERHGVAESTFVEQRQCWTCCCCGRNGNPSANASCPVALCGHVRCASRCAARWVR